MHPPTDVYKRQVPQITNIMREAAEKIIRCPVKVVGPGLKTGLNILMDNPAQLGSDLVADAVAGLEEYPVPLIIFDMGTATTVSVIDSRKCYIGGMILPGAVSYTHLDVYKRQLHERFHVFKHG